MRVAFVQPGYLGDAVFLGPAVRAVKARWPEARILVASSPRGAPVARLLPGVDEVLVFDKRGEDAGPLGLWRAARRLRAFGADLALVPHYSARSGALARLAGIPRRVGYAPFCTERLPLDRALPFVDRILALAERAGAPAAGTGLQLRAPGDAADYADRVLLGAKPPLIGIVPGAEWATKRWGGDKFAALAGRLLANGGTAVLLGGPAERPLAREIALAIPGAIETAGNTIPEALALLARMDLVVGGDTGLVHAARALGRPAALIFGPTDPRRHRFADRERAVALGLECQPCHDHGPDACPLGHHQCMRGLAPERVEEAARALLDAPRAATVRSEAER